MDLLLRLTILSRLLRLEEFNLIEIVSHTHTYTVIKTAMTAAAAEAAAVGGIYYLIHHMCNVFVHHIMLQLQKFNGSIHTLTQTLAHISISETLQPNKHKPQPQLILLSKSLSLSPSQSAFSHLLFSAIELILEPIILKFSCLNTTHTHLITHSLTQF